MAFYILELLAKLGYEILMCFHARSQVSECPEEVLGGIKNLTVKAYLDGRTRMGQHLL